MILQLSDPHLGAPTGDPEGDLARTVDRVRELALRPAVVLVTGDLAEHGDPAEYARVRELVAPLAAPILALPGNHDEPRALRAEFPGTAHDGAIRVLTLDSHRPGRDDGALGPEQLARLDADLGRDPRTPTVVALHHPPLTTGMPFLDDIGLDPADTSALRDVAARHPQVRRIACGHVHMTVSALIGPTPVLTCPSTWRERARLRLGAPGYELEDAPAGFAVHLLAGGELTSHVVTF